MTTTMEFREALGGQTVGRIDPVKRQVTAKVCSYNVGPDTYGTTWQRGCFTDGFRKHGLPVVCWAHDQRDVIGSAVDYEDRADGLYMTLQLADPNDVPSARRAFSLIRDNHVRGWSFGFSDGRTEPDPRYRGAQRFRSARLFEVSPVVRASIPGTKTVEVRAAGVLTVTDVEVAEAEETLRMLTGGGPKNRQEERRMAVLAEHRKHTADRLQGQRKAALARRPARSAVPALPQVPEGHDPALYETFEQRQEREFWAAHPGGIPRLQPVVSYWRPGDQPPDPATSTPDTMAAYRKMMGVGDTWTAPAATPRFSVAEVNELLNGEDRDRAEQVRQALADGRVISDG